MCYFLSIHIKSLVVNQFHDAIGLFFAKLILNNTYVILFLYFYFCILDCETDSCCSSVESFHDEDRVMLRISERLRQYLEYDYDMIVKYGKQHALPSRIPVVAILEKFVKQTALKMVFTTNQQEGAPRRRTAQPRTTDKKEKDVDKIIAT